MPVPTVSSSRTVRSVETAFSSRGSLKHRKTARAVLYSSIFLYVDSIIGFVMGIMMSGGFQA